MHAFIFTMFIIAIKTGHGIPEQLFGKESSHGAGARRSLAERRQGRAGDGWMLPFLSWEDAALVLEEGEQSKGCSFCCSGGKEHPRAGAGGSLAGIPAGMGGFGVDAQVGWSA